MHKEIYVRLNAFDIFESFQNEYNTYMYIHIFIYIYTRSMPRNSCNNTCWTLNTYLINDLNFLINLKPFLQEFYPEGHYIIKQDTLGDKFYILSEGRVKVTKTNKGKSAVTSL